MADNKKNFPIALENENVKARFNKLLGESASAFVSALLAIWNGNEKLQECDTKSILGAAGLAATLKLSLAPSLGHAYIVPYKGRATFQIGWKGILQLAHRTNKYKTFHAGAVKEGEIRGVDCITGELIRGEKISDKVIGYVAYVCLLNGFEKSLFMTREEMEEHAQKYSQSYAYDLKSGKKSSVWSTNFDAMARKTVMKLLLNRWGILSSGDMATALQADQGVVDKNTITYVDNDGRTVQRENYEMLDEVPFDTQTQTVDAETGEILEVENGTQY